MHISDTTKDLKSLLTDPQNKHMTIIAETPTAESTLHYSRIYLTGILSGHFLSEA